MSDEGMFHISWAQVSDLEVSLDELYCICGDKRGYSLVDNALNSLAGGGVGIHRRDPARNDFDYGAEYRAKVGYSCTCVSVALVTIPCLERLGLSFVSIKE